MIFIYSIYQGLDYLYLIVTIDYKYITIGLLGATDEEIVDDYVQSAQLEKVSCN